MMSPLCYNILCALLDACGLETRDKTSFIVIIDRTYVQEQDGELAYCALSTAIKYYENHIGLTEAERSVIEKLLRTIKALPVNNHKDDSVTRNTAITPCWNQAADSKKHTATADITIAERSPDERELELFGTHMLQTLIDNNTKTNNLSSNGRAGSVGARRPPHTHSVPSKARVPIDNTLNDKMLEMQSRSDVNNHLRQFSVTRGQALQPKDTLPADRSKRLVAAKDSEQQFEKPTTQYNTEQLPSSPPLSWNDKTTIFPDLLSKNYSYGSKVMKKMGWYPGTGLGVDGKGIKEPICSLGPIIGDSVASTRDEGRWSKQVISSMVCTSDNPDTESNPGKRPCCDVDTAPWHRIGTNPSAHESKLHTTSHIPAPSKPLLCLSQQVQLNSIYNEKLVGASTRATVSGKSNQGPGVWARTGPSDHQTRNSNKAEGTGWREDRDASKTEVHGHKSTPRYTASYMNGWSK